MTTTSRYPRSLSGLFGRMYGKPLLMRPEKAFEIERVLRHYQETPASAFFDSGAASTTDDVDDSGYIVTAGGVAIVPVMGTLVQRSSWMDAMSGLTSYDSIGYAVAQAEADPNVKGILLEIDSGGGEVNGCFDLVDEIATSTKPVWAVANEAAYSAAYAIASAADRIFMPRTAGVGSIGVVALHVDQSEKDKKQGVTYTPIFAGDHKVDGNSHAPLPDDVKASFQADIDRLYQLFVSTVAANRSMSAGAVIATQADTFHPAAAIDLGLADDTGTLDDAITLFETFLNDPSVAQSRTPGAFSRTSIAAAAALAMEPAMDQQNQAANTASITPETLAAARAEAATAGRNEGVTVGADAERARVAAILGSEEAKGRTTMATHLALETGMAAVDALKLLAKSPKEAPTAAATNAFAAAMDNVPNPKVRADNGDGSDVDPEKAAADESFRLFAKFARPQKA